MDLTSNTSNPDAYGQLIRTMSHFQVFECVFLSSCLVVSTAGNSYVIWLSKLRLQQKNAVSLHVLVLTLSLAELLQGLFQTLPYLSQVIVGEWICGEFMCKVHAVARSMLANVSISTLALIAIIRFVNIEVIDGTDNIKGYVMALVAVWLLQGGLAAPFGVWNTVLEASRTCNVPFEDLAKTKEYTLIFRVLCFFVPLVAMWICNVGVVLKMKASTRRIQPFTASIGSDINRHRRHTRVTLTCLSLALVFTLTLTPFEAALIVVQVDTDHHIQMSLNVLEYLWLLTVLNTCVNPFIYGLCLKDFRQRFARVLENFVHQATRTSTVNRPYQQNTLKQRTNGRDQRNINATSVKGNHVLETDPDSGQRVNENVITSLKPDVLDTP